MPGRRHRGERTGAADPDTPGARVVARGHDAGEQDCAGLRCGTGAAAPELPDPLAPGGGAAAPRPAPIVNDRDWLARGPVVVANGRWVPPAGFVPPDRTWALGGPVRRPAGLRPGRARGRRRRSSRRASTRWFERMTARHGGIGRRRRVDRPPLGPRRPQREPSRARLRRAGGKVGVSNRHLADAGAGRARPTGCCIHETARIDPYTVFDTTNGPIIARRRASGSSRSRGSRARARSAATPSSSGPTSAAA